METLNKRIFRSQVDHDEIMQHLQILFPLHCEGFLNPPGWVAVIKDFDLLDNGWQQRDRRGHIVKEDDSIYSYWMNGRDLDFIQQASQPPPRPLEVPTPAPNINKFAILADSIDDQTTDDAESSDEDASDIEDRPVEEMWERAWDVEADPVADTNIDVAPVAVWDNTAANPLEPLHPPSTVQSRGLSSSLNVSDLQNAEDFFQECGFDGIPTAPNSDRPLVDLLDLDDIWLMSRSERERLHAHWEDLVIARTNDDNLQDFQRLRTRHEHALRQYQENKDEVLWKVLILTLD
jgi:hypothetical protein